MSRAAEAIEHAALSPGGCWRPREAQLSDRARVGVLLQAAGLLSLCDLAGWRLRGGFEGARIDESGRLRALVAEPGGGDGERPLQALAELARELFGGGAGIAGRGQARRAARGLLERWRGAIDRGSADRAVADLFEAAPFLGATPFAATRAAALAGALVKNGARVEWRAGRAGEGGADAGSLTALVAAARWRQAASLGRAHPRLAEAAPLAFARALYATGRAERALEALARRHDVESEMLRAECQLLLGELGAARETVRRLDACGLTVDERLAFGDTALRVLANAGQPEAAREWAAATLARARAARRAPARWLVALAAVDRGDLASAARTLAERGSEPLAERWSRLELETRLSWAIANQDGTLAGDLAAAALGAGRRRMGLARAGRLWNNLGLARSLRGEFRAAERAFSHSARLLRRCDGPAAVILPSCNLADTRLRVGKLRDVESILAQATAFDRRSGNWRGLLEDELLWARWDLVGGEWERAVERCRRAAEEGERRGLAAVNERLAVLAARALGWLGRPLEARTALAAVGDAALVELEPEERPFLLALAGEADRALAEAARTELAALATRLVAGESPELARWRSLDALEPYRRARFVLDAELLAPGCAPAARRSEAAAVFRRLGALRALAVCERADTVAWRALAIYFERPAGERAAIEELLRAVGHPEASLVRRDPGGELPLAGPPARGGFEERAERLDEGELVLRAAAIDEPLRALFAVFRRDLPAPQRALGAGDSPLAGESPALHAAISRLHRFAAGELPVLILGENGTGKELAAAEIHRQSARRGGPFVPVNCAGLSEALLLSELFGHVRGAFTGADQARAGVFEAARGGTVFLDEIGDLPPAAQGSLLRVLQEGEIRRLGESLPRKVDVRVVAATHRALEEMVAAGAFRQDLYYRLKVARVSLPPLRERGQDVLLLADRFVAQLVSRGRRVRLAAESRRALAEHSWPGNVRELRNAIEAAAALCEDGVIRPHLLDLGLPPALALPAGEYHAAVERFRRGMIEEALRESGGSLAQAARRLGVTRQYLSQYARAHALGLRR